jgi:TEA/ATTS domain family protein
MNPSFPNSVILPSNALPPHISLQPTPTFTPLIPSILQERSTNSLSQRHAANNAGPDFSINKLGDDGSGRFLSEMYRTNFQNYRQPNDIEINRQATELKHRFEANEAYRKYREKGREDKVDATGRNGQAEKKWPDDMEMAFFKGTSLYIFLRKLETKWSIALIIYPPVGRRQLNCPSGKLRRGRNEVIAEAIQRWTGQTCKRKQVSSHIQVLRLKVKNDPLSMLQIPYERH